MWVFTLYGFYSVICARNQDGATTETNTLMVRARVRHHLATLQGRFTELADYSIRETPDTDYRFRIIVPKARWKEAVAQMVEELSYGNFKDEVARTLGFGERDYIHALHDVWSRLYDLQQESSNSVMGSTFRVRGLKMMRSANPDLPMSQMERIYKLDRLFRRRKPPSRHEILEMFEISPAQFKRDLEYMRNRLGAPVTFDMEAGGYKYTAEEFNLPGLWFTEREVYSLLLMHSLLDQLQPGFVREQLGPFSDKLRALLGKPGRGAQSILERMQVSAAPQRPIDPEHFQAISDTTLRRKKLRMRYYSRSRGVESDRVVSPQRVIYYRGNWYLDGWCHEKEAMRRFAIDAVRLVSVLEEPALEVATSGQQGYGIFSGPAENTAVLLFDAVAARWIAEEEWHPLQRASALPDGRLQLEVPYGNPQEILMDILRHGPHVEVVSPASLRSAVAETHREAAEKYALPKRSVDSVRSTTGSRTVRAR